ncbi:hypothetical protein [Enterococcus cecorum]|uniref:DUF3784 domain-containing protein n=1 Tax=Enterococcus cecorum TaxID=44008 RepID=A0A200I094_9ENTE|nr:hypothetical protein [Enterococcus cecorum]KLO73283.1 hypothetical protein AA988_00490 [Enterococcus cecorum]MCJ0571053.1 hypothetical protein [Enterococcus cecorum]MCJ0590100.1 hypothetical protein [Enterococcus cecorum]MDZ5502655.1 hypothetical protein [Enterococcus cecorum]MDZ5556556.1 hypothetical protein [Enterococcus cecorum]
MLIQILLFIMALLLLVIGYFLIFKTTIALQFLKPKEDLASVLSDYGKFFVIGGILGIVCTFMNDRFFSICFIIAVFILSGVFSSFLAKNLKL